jgi:hypothetical protein
MSGDVSAHGLTLATGEAGEVVAWDGTVFAFRSPRAFAPGAPVRLALVLGEHAVDLELKAIGSRRGEGEPLFLVRGRAMNLRREARAVLDAALRSG